MITIVVNMMIMIKVYEGIILSMIMSDHCDDNINNDFDTMILIQ